MREQVEKRSPDDRSYTGLGIGLALVKDLVRLHDGTVQAKNKGSVFTVHLPLIEGEGESAP